jgi:hypothetical protein
VSSACFTVPNNYLPSAFRTLTPLSPPSIALSLSLTGALALHSSGLKTTDQLLIKLECINLELALLHQSTFALMVEDIPSIGLNVSTFSCMQW